MIDPRPLEARHELRRLGMLAEELPQRVVLVVDVLVTFLQGGVGRSGGRGRLIASDALRKGRPTVPPLGELPSRVSESRRPSCTPTGSGLKPPSTSRRRRLRELVWGPGPGLGDVLGSIEVSENSFFGHPCRHRGGAEGRLGRRGSGARDASASRPFHRVSETSFRGPIAESQRPRRFKHHTYVSHSAYRGSWPRTTRKYISWTFFTTGPTAPVPIRRLSTSRTGVISAAVPVKKTSLEM